MKKKLILSFIVSFIISVSLMLTAKAEFAFAEEFDTTGDAYFSPGYEHPFVYAQKKKKHISNPTMPPVKILRLNIQNKMQENAMKNMELAPTIEEESIYAKDESTSSYTSKEVKDDFEDMASDGFEADEEAVAETEKKKLFAGKKEKQEKVEPPKEGIILDCENVDYDTQNYLIKASGNVVVNFINQKTIVKSNLLTFDRINNTIKAEGNVRIVKSGRVVTGDYIFVDLNEENAIIESPMSRSESVEIRSKKGYVYGDKIIQEEGRFEIVDDYPIEFRSGRRGPRLIRMLVPEEDTFSEDLEKGLIKMRADSIKIRQNGDLEIISLKKLNISKGKHAILKLPSVKLYTNKHHDFGETNLWEIGYYRGLGLYTGPGFVFGLPKGAVVKAVPFLNYNEGYGIGGLGRIQSGTNETTVAYGSAAKRFFVYGRQDLDDNLYLHYSVNSYMDEWFLGRRRPKYGAALVYKKAYPAMGFLIPNQFSSFSHRIEAGYFHDLDFDANFEKIKRGGTMGTTRFRYMAQATQSLFNYQNPEKLTAFSFSVFGQLSAALYGTGDTQVIGKIGPSVRMQYKRWMQELRYSFNAYDDNTPMARYDAYRFGSQYLHIREYLRICKWLTVSWFSTINTTNDTINKKRLQENTFYLSVGPEDVKFHVGYDFERQTMRAAVEVMMDAKGTNVEYNTFEIKQDKKSKKEIRPVDKSKEDLAPTQPRVLQKAVVENVKVVEDVL